jgi:tetratricopeptide (TPR) repeat protein
MLSLAIIAIGSLLSGATTPEESGTLVRSARELLRDGQPAKAKVLLKRARSLDTNQVEIDRLVAQCQARLGSWVPDPWSSEWVPGDDRLPEAVRRNPDSLASLLTRLVAAEDLSNAVRLGWALSQHHGSDSGGRKTYQELRLRQEARIAFHRDLALEAQGRGELGEAASQWRMAWSARPEDAGLRDMVERADQASEAAGRLFQTELRQALAQGELMAALDLARRGRIAFPGMEPFQQVFDSLEASWRILRERNMARIAELADLGRDQEAMAMMESLVEADPRDPFLVQAQSSLQNRLQRRRRRALAVELVRSGEAAIQGGDLSRAEEVLADLRRIGSEGAELDRLQARVDSVRGVDRSASAFADAMSAARFSLKSGDVVGGRVHLQKALALQPGHAVAKSLLANLASSRSVSGPSKPSAEPPLSPPANTPERQAKAKELLLAGVAHYRSGEYDQAIAKWTKVLELDSTSVQARKYLANVGQKRARLK